MEEDLKQKSEIKETADPTAAAATPQTTPVADNASAGQPADPYGLNAANDLLSNPKVKKYMGRMSKVLIGFAILGSIMMILAVTAISTLFNMIIPK